MLRFLARAFLVLVPFLLVGGGILIWGYGQMDRPTARSLRGDGFLMVEPGSSLRSVTAVLADSGWIRHPRIHSSWGRLRGQDRSIQTGCYRLRRGWTPRQVMDEILAGRVDIVQVTIPEGWRESQILDLLADSLRLDRRDMLAAARDTAWMRSLGLPGDCLEGYLFPETYRFPRRCEPRAALARLIDEADSRFDETMRERADRIGMTRDEVVVLASIIQAEAAQEGEMPRISAVFHNRLADGWKLEADPTVLYALDRLHGPVLFRDLEVDSPYNTYRVVGLPAGPIGNPGSAALMAALWPDSGRGEYYFVAKGDGEHLFSRTLAEHNRARSLVRAQNGRR
jgi:UPF0755 protein